MPLLPAALFIIGLALFASDKLYLIIVALTPLSVSLEQLEFGLGVALPTEPLMFGLMSVFLIRNFFSHDYDKNILRHPITLAIVFQLIWFLFTSIPSELPVVSFKFFLSRMWLVVSCFFFAAILFKYQRNVLPFLWAYILPLAAVIIYTVVNHALLGFEEKPAHWVMQPFFKDHTGYGAIVAMYMPPIVATLTLDRVRPNMKIAVFMVLLVFLAGVIFSYTRAAWVSLAVGFVVYLFIKFKVKFKYLTLAGIVGLFVLFSFKDDILIKLEKNRQDSSDDLTEHVQSISNVATDASNLERINRWKCAMQMFEERPFFGFGPGTYAFLYAPYQQSGDLTIISTNFGDGGNAHSEYLGLMAESGAIGFLSFLLIVFLTVYIGVKRYYHMVEPDHKRIMMGILIGYITYITHGVLNNFLDTDKASVPFWGFTALIVAYDVYYTNRREMAEGQ